MESNHKINEMFNQARIRINDYIEVLHIQAISKLYPKTKKETTKASSKIIEDFLKKRGYTMNYVLGKPIMVKSFTCVSIQENYVEIWHDKTNNNKSVFINDSLLTGLPITLEYMERI